MEVTLAAANPRSEVKAGWVPAMVKSVNKHTWTLLLGPMFSVGFATLAVEHGWLHTSMLSWALTAALIIWSPLPISVPAILADKRAAKRSMPLLPMVWRQQQLNETRCHIAGLAVAVVAAMAII